MCAVYECGIDTPRHSFPTTAVAVRKTIAQRQSQSIKNVCAAQAQSRDLNYCGPKTNAKVLTNNLLWIQLEKSCAEREVRFVHPPLWCPPWADHQRHSNFWLEAIVDLSFFPLPWFVPPRTCPPTIPLRWRWWGWVCFRSSDILDVVSLEECLFQFVWSSIFFNESFYATDMAGCTPQFHRVLLTSRCPSVPVRPLCVFVGALVVCMFNLFPTICAAVEVNFRSTWVFWICDSFSNTPSTMISHHGPLQLFRRWPTSMSSSGLFDDRALTTWEPLSIDKEQSFLVVQVARQVFNHICNILRLFCGVWCTKCIEGRLRCFFRFPLKNLSNAQDFSQRSRLQWFSVLRLVP